MVGYRKFSLLFILFSIFLCSPHAFADVFSIDITVEAPGGGGPVQSASVELFSPGGSSLGTEITDTGGMVFFSGAPDFPDGNYTIEVTKGADSTTYPLAVSGISSFVETVEFPQFDTIEITLETILGDPIVGFDIEMFDFEFMPLGTFQTDGAGQVTFTGVFPDGEYTVNATNGMVSEPFTLNLVYAGDEVFQTTLIMTGPGASSVDQVRVTVENSVGDPLEDVPVELEDFAQMFLGACQTDQAGRCDLFLINDGTYNLKLPVQSSPGGPTGAAYIDTFESVTIDLGSALFDSDAFVYYQEVTVTLLEADRKLVVSVYESQEDDPNLPDLSKPIADAFVDLFSYDQPDFFSFSQTDDDGKAYLPLTTMLTGFASLNAMADDFSGTFQEIEFSPGAQDVTATMVLQPTDAEITVSLQDEDGDPVVAEDNGSDFSDTRVNCYVNDFDFDEENPGQPLFFNSEVDIGQSSVEVDVVGGRTYECSAEKEGGTTFSTGSVDVAANGSASLTLSAITTDASVTIRLIDPDTGQPITNQNFDVSVWTEPPSDGTESMVSHHAFGFVESGSVTLDLISGIPYRGVIFQFEQGEEPFVLEVGEYLSEKDFRVEEAQDGLNIDVVIDKLDAQLTVCLKDSNGELVSQGFAFADSPSGDDSPPEEGPGDPTEEGEEDLTDFLFSGAELQNGCGTFGVKSGRYYIVNADPFIESEEELENFALSPDQVVNLDPGEQRTLNFRLEKTNFDLAITIDEEASSFGSINLLSDAEFAGCMAERIDGMVSYTTQPEERSFNLKLAVKNKKLPVSKQQPFKIICAIFIPSETEGGIGESYFEEFAFIPTRNSSAATVAVAFDDADPFYPPTSTDVQPNATTKIVTPGGAVNIPPGALGQTGQFSFEYKSPTVSPRVSGYKALLLLDYTPKQDGVPISSTLQPIEICFNVTDADLQEAGAPFESFVIGHLNDSTNRFTFPSVTRTTETLDDGSISRKMCISTNEFSVFGKLIDIAGEAKRSTPVALRIAKPKAVIIKSKKGKKKKSGKKGKKMKRWKVTFDFEGAESTQRFLFKYSFAGKKKCNETDPDDLPSEQVVEGTGNFFVTGNSKKKNLCGSISALGNGRFSSNAYRGNVGGKKKKRK